MTPRTWAERKVEKHNFRLVANAPWLIKADVGAKLLLAEHQRAVRICKRYQRLAINGKLGFAHDQSVGFVTACNMILAALERGRGKGGK